MRTPTRLILALAVVAASGCNCNNPNATQNQPPTVDIQSPSDATVARAGTALGLKATATDPEDGELSGASVVWTSSISGQVATGTTADITLNDVGDHTLTVTATDSGGMTNGKSVHVTVISANAPTVAIVSPAAGATFALGELITFQCTATTVGGAPIPDANIQWSSALSGALPGGANMQATLTTAGADTITCTATDPANNESASATVAITVSQAQASSLQILQPDVNELWVKPGGNGPFSNTVQFTATARDPNVAGGAGNLDQAITWKLTPGDVSIGTGAQAQYTFGTLGDFVVTASAVDSRQVTVADTITVHVVNNIPPQCEIARPQADGQRYATQIASRLTGTCFDPETNSVIAPTWTAELEPSALGTGFNIFATFTVTGNELLSACSVDPQDAALKGCATRAISVFNNTAPQNCAIQLPANNAIVNAGVPVQLKGSATDAEDPVNTLEFRWSSNLDGNLGTGADTTTLGLTTPGAHTLTLTVFDPWGLSCAATVTVTLNGAPQVAITAVTQGNTNCLNGPCAAATDIAATGTATDPQGISTYDWKSSLQGSFGAAATATLMAPLPGKHMLVFSAADTQGAVGTAARQITVLPQNRTQLADTLATTGNDVLGLTETAPGTLLFVDGNNQDLLRWTQGNGVQNTAQLGEAGVSLAVVGGVTFVGTDGAGVERCANGSCTRYQNGLLAQGGNVVNAIAGMDTPDLLVLGTDDGLVITRASDPSLGAANNVVGGKRMLGGSRIRALLVSPSSTASTVKVWAGTDNGLVELAIAVANPFDPVNAQVTTTAHRQPQIPNDNVRSLAISPEGNVYAGTDRGFSLDLSGGTVHLRQAPWSFPDERVQALLFERRSIDGTPHDLLWAGTASGLIRYDLGLKVPSRMTTADGLPSNNITSLTLGSNGQKYIGTANGLAVYDGP